MFRSPILLEGYRPQFSGHETFPLRYGWLKKAFDAVSETDTQLSLKSVFLGEDAIARFGVGKNMVASIRHWATAARIIGETPGSKILGTTALGRKLFGPQGLDRYMENPASLWIIHWQLAARPEKTTWYWAFSHFPSLTLDREQFLKSLERLARERGWSRVASTTIRNDIACFLRTYVAQPISRSGGKEDSLESPLTELDLIKAVGKRDGFRFVRGSKAALGDGVFAYALADFWMRQSEASSLSFEAVTHHPGSPGRVFLLDENEVIERLGRLEELTAGRIRWSETAGLKQVVRDIDLSEKLALSFAERDFARAASRRAIYELR